MLKLLLDLCIKCMHIIRNDIQTDTSLGMLYNTFKPVFMAPRYIYFRTEEIKLHCFKVVYTRKCLSECFEIFWRT